MLQIDRCIISACDIRQAAEAGEIDSFDSALSGLPWSGKNYFFQGQGILHQVREILNSSLKSVKSRGILFSGCHKL